MKRLELRSVNDQLRRAALEEFRHLMSQETKEAAWQDLFDKYPFILAETLPVNMTALFSQVPLETGRADYVFVGESKGLFGDHGVIELKQPDHPVVRVYSSQHITPSSKLTEAYMQSRRYLNALHNQGASALQDHFVIGNRSHAFIIIGRTQDTMRKCVSDSHRAQLAGLLDLGFHVFAYDELMELYAGTLPRHVSVLIVSEPTKDYSDIPIPTEFRGIEVDEDGYLEGSNIWIGKWK